MRIGIDEVGRGSLAGPVVAGAVALPVKSKPIAGIADSKLLTPRQRTLLLDQIIETATWWNIGLASAQEINSWGIVKATATAMARALSPLKRRSEIIIDGLDNCHLKQLIPHPYQTIVKADATIACVAAANIVAKTFRDAVISWLRYTYPLYGFEAHKGYGTKHHREALLKYGSSCYHRSQFVDTFLQRTKTHEKN